MTNELQLFMEDADEQLTFMENALVNMQEDGVNDEDVGALFRAMHTIKGTAGMFGFDDVVGFTHIAENLLSEVRSKTVELTVEMLELFLLTKDHTETLIQIASEHKNIDDELQIVNDELLLKLKACMPGAVVEDTKSESSLELKTDNSSNVGESLWYIGINLREEFYTSGMDIINIISFLEDLGEIKSTVAATSDIPKLEDYKPLSAYMGFHIKLLSDSSYEDIEEVFEFILDDLELFIFKMDDEESLKKMIDLHHDKGAFKSFLIENKVFTQEQLEAPDSKIESVNKPTAEIEEDVNANPLKKPINVKKSNEEHKPEKTNFSLRVDSSKVDQLINQISEMVIANAKIAQRADELDDVELTESTSVMSDMLEEVRSSVMDVRMVQVGDTFAKFRRIVGDTAKKIGKDINFTINGGETELDKMVVEKISDPIMHMLRNSVDHGVEMPDDRVTSGKDKTGNVILSAYPDAGTIVIEIKDDGKGLDKDAIVQKAINNGTLDPNHTLSDSEIYKLIFEAGLSTAKEVSDISGRGVGMDVVKRNIESLRGTVEIDSTLGEGSTFTIRLPLTLAIIDGFLIQSGETKYIIPLEMIQECIELSSAYKEQMQGNEFINLRDSILPLLNIRRYLNEADSKTQRENIVVVRYGKYKMGLEVDELFGEFQTVIKPLGKVFEGVPGISGGTILGSGEIALIFDIPKLIEHKIKNC
ncbi:MAG: chemotaxis protein CheA [Campylobacterota bacterium]|nr:chemotaxis protein CheA [Campylobacterota bacterium]